MKKRLYSEFLLLVYALIMGATSIILKQVTQELEIFAFMANRFFCAFLISLILFGPRCRGLFSSSLIKHAVITGVVTYAAHFFCTVGISVTPVGVAGFLTSLQTIVIPIIAFLVLKQHLETRTLLCVIGAFIGICLISIGNLEYSSGAWLCILSSILAGIQILLIEYYVKQGDDGSALMIIELGTMAACAFFVALGTDGVGLPQNKFGWFSVLWTGTVSTAVATYIQNYAQKYTTSVHTGLIFSTIPVFTLIGSRIVFHESFSLRAWVGALLLLICVIAVQLGNRTESVPPVLEKQAETDQS